MSGPSQTRHGQGRTPSWTETSEDMSMERHAVGTGWHDLSHVLQEGMPRMQSFPAPRFTRLKSRPNDPLQLTEMQMVCHVGTHLDAPNHFVEGAPGIDEIPLDRLHRTGVVWHLDCAEEELIGPDALASATPRPHPGDMVLLSTGWARHFGTPHYDRHPSLTTAAARWLVDHGVSLLGVDLPTPDLPAHRRPADFDWPVHHVLLGAGVLIGEHLTGLVPLAGQRVEVLFLPVKIEGSDGGPARVLARPRPTTSQETP